MGIGNNDDNLSLELDDDSDSENNVDFQGNIRLQNDSSIDYEKLASDAVKCCFHIRFADADALVRQYSNEHPLTCGALAFKLIFEAGVVFEPNIISASLKEIKELIKNLQLWTKCEDIIARYQARIQLVNSYIYVASLFFIKQELTSYIKGGWFCHKAWKLFSKTHKELFSGSLDIPENDLKKLQAASSFGHGVTNLLFSIAPMKSLALIKFFGLSADKTQGLKSLEVSAVCHGEFHSSISLFVLVWYSSFVEPMVQCKYSDFVDKLIEARDKSMQRCDKDFLDSPFYSFISMYFASRLDGSYSTIDFCNSQLEKFKDEDEFIAVMFNIQIGRSKLIQREYSEAIKTLEFAISKCKWGMGIYEYGVCIAKGAMGELKEAEEILNKLKKMKKRSASEADFFVNNRVKVFSSIKLTVANFQLFCLELCYHWVQIPSITESDALSALHFLRTDWEPRLRPLATFLEGTLLFQIKDYAMAFDSLQEARSFGKPDPNLKFIFPFATYKMAVCLINQNKSGYDALFQEARDRYKSYEFEQRLHFLIHNREISENQV